MKLVKLICAITMMTISLISFGKEENFAPTLSVSSSSVCSPGYVTVTVNNMAPFGGGQIRFKYVPNHGGIAPIQTKTVNFENKTSVSTSIYISEGHDFWAEVDYSFGTDYTTNTRSVNFVPIDGGTLKVAGSTGTQNICIGDQVTLSLSGYEGSITWYKSVENNIWQSVGNQGSSYTVSPNADVKYKVTARKTGCSVTDDSNVMTINVDPSSVAGSVSSNTSNRCSTGAISFTLSGHRGTIHRWQSRYKNGSGGWSGWSTVTETNNVTSVSPTLSQWSGGQRTYEVRATVQSGSCNVVYAKKQVTVDPVTVAGSISRSVSNRCGNGSVTFSISGHTGTVHRWQYRYKNGSGSYGGWTTYEETNNVTSKSLSVSQWSGGQRTYQVQAVVKSGSCGTLYPKQTVVVNPIPSLASGSSKSRCGSGTLTLTASPGSNGNTIRWYSAASGGTLLHTGTSYTTPSLSSNKTYYAASYNSSTGCIDSDRKAITAIINPIPSLASGSNKSRCGTGTVTFNASPGSNGNTIRWYSAATGGTLLHTGTSYTTPSLSSNTTYYAASYNSSTGCLDSDRKAIAAVINPIPSLASGSNKARCGSGTVTLTASSGSNGNNIRWYSAASGGTLLHTGTSYTTPSLSSSKTYYAASYNSTTGCIDSDRKAITAVINPIPSLASGSNKSRCGNGTVTLTASPGSNGNTIRWYSAASGGTLLHTGTSYTTPSLSSNKTYYAASYNSSTGCTDSDRKAIMAIVNPIPSLATGSNKARCGSGTVTLTASSGSNGNTIRWYSASSGGTLLHTGTSFTTPSLSTNTTYYAASYNNVTGCLDSDRKAITAVVNATPTLASGSDNDRCGAGAVTLTASPGGSGTTIRWYSASSGGTLLHTGNSYTTPSIFTNTTYYAASYNSTYGCEDSDRKAITAIINTIPSQPSGFNMTRCGTGTVSFTSNPGANGNSIRWYDASAGGSLLHTGVNFTTPSISADQTYYAATYNTTTGCESSNRKALLAIVYDPSEGGDIAGEKEEFGVASGALSLQNQTGNVVKWQYKTTGAWTDISNTSTSLNYTNVQETTEYRAVVQSADCPTDYSSVATISILNVPSVDLGISQNVRPGSGTILTASSGHANYTWYRDNLLIQDGIDNSLVVNKPGEYKVTVTSHGNATYTTGNAIIDNQLEPDENAVITFTYRVPVTDASDPFLFDVAEQSITSRIYDGLGRPIQEVSLQSSPFQDDMVVPIEYDEYDRRPKSYLPYPDADLSLLFKPSALNSSNYSESDQHIYYDQSVYNESNPYSETRFESSPLNRPLEQGAPGSDWQIGANTVKFFYDVADSVEVIDWDFESLLTSSKGFVPGKSIFKNTTTDEDGNSTIEFKNAEGQIILKKLATGDASKPWASTYYIYDIYGNLSCVLPPEATDQLNDFFQHNADRQGFLNTWAFLYDYDGRNRMIMKKVPGADSVFMVYDQWDRLVLSQDGNQRNNNQWLFTKYDALNRPIMTGVMSGGSVATEREAVAAETDRFETFSGTEINQYTDVTYPSNAAVDEYLTVTYYDDYEFQSHADWTSADLAFTNPIGLVQNTDVKGQVTGTMTKANNGSWIKSVSYFDDKYRVIQSQSTNHLSGKDVVTNYYDFIGQVTKSISTHSMGGETKTATRRFEYDHVGRLLKTWHKLDDGAEIQISENRYNELGELVLKDLHKEIGVNVVFDPAKISGYAGSQDINPTAWNLENEKTLKVGDGNTWKKSEFQYTVTSETVIEFEFKSTREGEIQGIGLDNNNSLSAANTFQLSGTQAWGNQDFSYNDSGDWQKFVIPVGQYYTGAMSYLIFANDHDASPQNANGYFRNIRVYENDDSEFDSSLPHQTLDYKYNIRGWLTEINDAELSDSDDLFGMELMYNEVDVDVSNGSLYNGNISGMKWSTINDKVAPAISERSYRFTYDNLNRLLATNSGRNWAGTWAHGTKHYESSYSYDLNGNIKALSRYPDSGVLMDDLTYGYEGNQLLRVSDAATDTTGFSDGNTTGDDYDYDANGNMIQDLNKGISSISYNHLNLPSKVVMAGTGEENRIEYLYDAAGIKLQQKVFKADTVFKVTDYIGEYIYETDNYGARQLNLVQHEEGRIIPLNEPGVPVDSSGIELTLTLDGNANDSSGKGRNGIVNGATMTAGKDEGANGAYSFDGVDDYIDLSTYYAEFNSLQSGSLSLWFKTSSLNRGAFLGIGNTTGDWFAIECGDNLTGAYTDESLMIALKKNGTYQYTAFIRNGTNFYNDGKWHHLVLVDDGNYNALYIDGVKQSLTYNNGSENSGGFLNVNSAQFALARRFYPNNPDYFNGSLDEINVFSRALSESEIQALYGGSKPGKTQDVIAGYDYQYHLKDHLGNVRVTFSTTPENYTMVENFESGQENGWQDLHRHTSLDANTTEGGDEVELLQSGQTGAMIFLGMNKGDTIDLQVNANYESAPSGNSFLGTAYNSLFNSFDNIYGSGVEGGISSSSTVFDDALNGADMAGKGGANSAPRAFLNYLLFDKDMNYITAGFQQISTAAQGVGVHEEIRIDDIIAEQEGYILAYLSNENQEAVNVHFDDFTVYHGKTNVVSVQDYYPFGGTFNSYTSGTENLYKYQGKEEQQELETFDFHARMYDPMLGRTWQIDPMSDLFYDHSPYSWVKNNPLLRIDPTGMTDFTFDKKSGEVSQVGEANDEPDRILRTNRKGEVKYKKNGEAKVAMGGIEQGILADGQNWKTDDQVIEVGGEGQPTADGVESFTLGLSEYIGKELSGYSYSSDGSGNVTDMLIGNYENNSRTESSSSPADLIRKYRDSYSHDNIQGAFHTHPDGKLGATQSAPHQSADVQNLQRDKPSLPNASFYILYRVQGQSKPAKYDYTHEYRAPRKKK